MYRMHHTIVVAALVLVLSFGIYDAYGERPQFEISKDVVYDGDRLKITGTVKVDPSSQSVTIQIFTPDKLGFADIQMAQISANGKFSVTTGTIDSRTWITDGTYIIRVFYAGEDAEKTVQYKKVQPEPTGTVDRSPIPIQRPQDPSYTPSPSPSPSISPAPPDKVPTNDIQNDTATADVSVVQQQQQQQQSEFLTLKLTVIHNFPSMDLSPQHYINRYTTESEYQAWFDSQFPANTIDEVVGYKSTHVENFPSNDKPPQHYITRYTTESEYQAWFDSQFPALSIHNVLGYANPPPIPEWIRQSARNWHNDTNEGAIAFASGVSYMLNNDIIIASYIPHNVEVRLNGIPEWFSQSAKWWADGLITDEVFVISTRYLVQQDIIEVW